MVKSSILSGEERIPASGQGSIAFGRCLRVVATVPWMLRLRFVLARTFAPASTFARFSKLGRYSTTPILRLMPQHLGWGGAKFLTGRRRDFRFGALMSA